MNIFGFRDRLIADYESYVRSFVEIRDVDIRQRVEKGMEQGLLWPEPLIQLNPLFAPGEDIDSLVGAGLLHAESARIFRVGKSAEDPRGKALRLHKHQSDAVRVASGGDNYVLTTGTGSGKSLAYMIPIVDHVLRTGSGRGVQAIVVYPMNALANSQVGELEKFLCRGYPADRPPVTFARYTGQENHQAREQIHRGPPDIILTNYVMLELILTRVFDRPVIEAAQGLRFLVLDELHTYRGRQGADVSMLVRRVRDRLNAQQLQCVGTSATLAGSGSFGEQRAEVARVATQIFGAQVKPEHVIGETLRRITPERGPDDEEFPAELSARVRQSVDPAALPVGEFVRDPLSIWIESTFGIRQQDDRLVRATPRSITGEHGAAPQLSDLTGISVERCEEVIQHALLAGYEHQDPDSGKPVFAFRLHQFISRGDTVHASLQRSGDRYVTLTGQQFVPGDRSRVLFPLVFCRECGEDYYPVRAKRDSEENRRSFAGRDLSDRMDEEDSETGFLFLGEANPNLLGGGGNSDELYPNAQRVRIGTSGTEDPAGLACLYLPAPFRRCLRCGVEYNARQRSDFSKLGTLGSGGRSTATTVLSLSSVRALRDAEHGDGGDRALPVKLLSFTDNRQDASLQSGHFNDFVEIGLLRSALFRAVRDAGETGVTHENLTQKVFDALALPVEAYAADPDVRYQAKIQTDRALRDVLGYRLYRDLKRGWRITMPNLEQSGLLAIRYLSLDELCRDEEVWSSGHPTLVSASAVSRKTIATTLLDYMRRELAIRVDYLDSRYQEGLKQQSGQRLVAPWSIDEQERMEHATILFPRPRTTGDYGGNVYLSSRGGFGQYLNRNGTFPERHQALPLEDRDVIIRELLEALRIAGLVEIAQPPRPDEVPGYQLPASAMLWLAGEGERAFHDPIRVPNPSAAGGRVNPFFVDFYRKATVDAFGFEAREHTAQVPYEDRQAREHRFREGQLPVLYCSPTMELGVDIADLNVVNMRNVPPTPANYAQRSGRAGRSGQPALVFTYCSSGSSHDQYFFKRPELMVAGAVTPPRLDLANEDLVRSHVQAIWLSEAGLNLGFSLKEILDLSGDEPSLELEDWVRAALEDEGARNRTRVRADRVLASISDELAASDWYNAEWLGRQLATISQSFEQALERWRELYRAAREQRKAQNAIVGDHSRSDRDRQEAVRLRREAESQLDLLTAGDSAFQSDFYSYRYFASEGFLPGYNFPRLPLSAYIPARQTRQRDDYLSRPRFLAISEFGPRAVVYHEGSRYVINKVILPVESDEITTNRMKQCGRCGYIHPIQDGDGQDRCDRCGNPLGAPLRQLFRLQNVSTKRRDKINSDEEERLRLGYEIQTGVRFGEVGDRASCRTATVAGEGGELARLAYGQAATIWRINLGWARRKEKHIHGFVLDTERGYWESQKALFEHDPEDPMSHRVARVIPYVEDRRNALLFEPTEQLSEELVASLQAALKTAVQVVYQLEDGELAAEPLPDRDNRRLILFFESAEGGAGVLRRLVDDPGALATVAREALRICHFDPETGEDQGRAPQATEDCEAACYDCLLNYSNQRDHALLDRKLLSDFLLRLAEGHVESAPANAPRADHLEAVLGQCESELERRWVAFLDADGYRLPSRAQVYIEACRTKPDFFYDEHLTAIYIDGPPHDFPDRQVRDAQQTEEMENAGYVVIRFGHADDWAAKVARYPGIFGRGS